MAELKLLIAKRGTIKGQLRRFSTFINSYDSSKVAELNIRLDKIVGILDEFNILQDQIDILCEINTNTDELAQQERESFENEYYKLVAMAKECLEPVTNLLQTQNNSTKFENNGTFKLPARDLPSFNGNYDQWLPFYETFKTLIHNDQTITDIQKFHCLKSCLKDEAAKLVDSLATTFENYSITWDLLVERYHNKELIIKNHVSALFALPTVTKDNSTAMRQLINTISLNLKVLHSLGLPTEQWDALIIYLVVSKLDYITARDWEENITTDIPALSDLIDFLKHKCESLESLQVGSKISSNQGSKPTYQRYVNNGALSVQNPSQIECSYCNQSHFIYSCEIFKELTAENAFQEARRLKLCTNCLRKGHSSMNCRSSGCKHCNKKHSTLFHGKKPSTSANPQESNIATWSDVREELNSNVYTLLSTACLQILDAAGQFHTCRAVLVTASHSNFITNDLANKLQLPSTHIDWKIISIINQNALSVDKLVNVTIKSKHNNFKSNINSVVLPKITEPIPSFDLDRSLFNIPSGIKLADNNFNKSSTIDLLLGAEIYWSLLRDGQFKIDNQPTLQNTHLGWILGGNVLLPYPLNDRTNSIVSLGSITISNAFGN
uniref:Uncharacterized protein n=1 Tax=Photinus pyralis TaxID=7054 RepID=A0A1Y1LJL9_PHOPY